MLKVRFETKINYITDEQLYVATVYIYLPLVEKELHPLLWNENIKIFGEKLTAYTGRIVNGERFVQYKFEAKTLDELMQIVNDAIKDAYETLQQVYKENILKNLSIEDEFELVIDAQIQ